MSFWRDRPAVRSHLWPIFFFSLPFQISYRIVKAFVICYFVFWIVICFALIGHRNSLFMWEENHLWRWSCASLSILHSYCVLIKTHMGKSLFSPELKSISITQWNCTTIGSCSGKKRTNGSAAELHEPMATIPARSRQNGRGIWLYKRSFRHRILRFLLLQRRRLRLHWPRSLLAVDTPRSWAQRPRSARLIRLSTRPSIAAVPVPFAARHPAIIT